jgi:hypothetical protein
MISVQEVVVDPDMIAPRPYTILRSTGKFVLGGFESVVTPISMFGPVQQASNKELQMLAEADRIGGVRSFWSTQPIYVTRGYAPVPGVHSEAPQGSGTTYELSVAPPNNSIDLYVNGLLLQPNGFDYTLVGTTIMFRFAPNNPPYVVWQETVNVATNASDQIQYVNDIYRIMQVYYDPGGGYWKALGTRLAAA